MTTNPTYKLPALNRRYVLVVSLFLVLASLAKAQPPADAISMEDAAFNQYFANKKPAVVAGRLLNATAAELKNLQIAYQLETPLDEGRVTKTISAGTDGRFEISPDRAYPYLQLRINVGYMFAATLYIKDGLLLELDMNQLRNRFAMDSASGVRYLGSDGAMNQYLSSYAAYRRDDRKRLAHTAEHLIFLFNDGPDALQRYQLLSDSSQRIQEAFTSAHPSQAYSWILESERLSAYYAGLCYYYGKKHMSDSLWQQVSRHKSYLVSKHSTDFYRHISLYVQQLGVPPVIGWEVASTLHNVTDKEMGAVEGTAPASNHFRFMEVGTRQPAQVSARLSQLAIQKQTEKSARLLDSVFAAPKAALLKLYIVRRKDTQENRWLLQSIYSVIQTDWCKLLLSQSPLLNQTKIETH